MCLMRFFAVVISRCFRAARREQAAAARPCQHRIDWSRSEDFIVKLGLELV